jgi:hypothetical protein
MSRSHLRRRVIAKALGGEGEGGASMNVFRGRISLVYQAVMLSLVAGPAVADIALGEWPANSARVR